MWRLLKRVLPTTVVVLLVLVGAGRGDTVSEKNLLTARYQHDLVQWEVQHFPDKWWHRLTTFVTRDSLDRQERKAVIDEYFALAEELRRLEEELETLVALPVEERERTTDDVHREVRDAQERQGRLQAKVEEALESEITSVLREMGIITGLGPVRWPPVDFALERSPLVLVTSPRDEIRRLGDLLLRPGVSLLDQERLEETVEGAGEVSALVVRVGGVATYPATVDPTASLHRVVVLASHEWLHHHLFFQPLGRRFWEGGDLASINETVANLAGREIGDRVFTRLTGQVVERPPYQPPSLEPREEPGPGVFDFRREMRETRIELEELLAEGLVEEAETYLEERRLFFVRNGRNIRKLNQAYFAFFGTYADNPASISPIEPQLQAIRGVSASLAEFMDRVSGITSAAELEELAGEAGWEPLAQAG